MEGDTFSKKNDGGYDYNAKRVYTDDINYKERKIL